MELTWLDATLLMLLFGLGSLIVQTLGRRRVQEAREKHRVICRKHDWVRVDSFGLICRSCGKIPG
jgi:hypothetical protein